MLRRNIASKTGLSLEDGQQDSFMTLLRKSGLGTTHSRRVFSSIFSDDNNHAQVSERRWCGVSCGGSYGWSAADGSMQWHKKVRRVYFLACGNLPFEVNI